MKNKSEKNNLVGHRLWSVFSGDGRGLFDNDAQSIFAKVGVDDSRMRDSFSPHAVCDLQKIRVVGQKDCAESGGLHDMFFVRSTEQADFACRDGLNPSRLETDRDLGIDALVKIDRNQSRRSRGMGYAVLFGEFSHRFFVFLDFTVNFRFVPEVVRKGIVNLVKFDVRMRFLDFLRCHPKLFMFNRNLRHPYPAAGNHSLQDAAWPVHIRNPRVCFHAHEISLLNPRGQVKDGGLDWMETRSSRHGFMKLHRRST